jgi:hypothetical protein
MVGGQDLRHLAVLPRLKSLNLSEVDVTDAGWAELPALESLEERAAAREGMSEAGSRLLFALKRLKELRIAVGDVKAW